MSRRRTRRVHGIQVAPAPARLTGSVATWLANPTKANRLRVIREREHLRRYRAMLVERSGVLGGAGVDPEADE